MKVAIAWYGAEGQASYAYYTQKGYDVTIVTPTVSADFPLPVDAKSIVAPDAFDYLNGFDLVVRSAATRPDALKTDGKIWSATNEFFKECKAPIIGVTGTKGKGTTSSYIASILRAGGKTVHLVGNIGVPPLQKLAEITPNDIVVFELSSFQLWDIERSPHIAVVLMIEPDHLNVHKDTAEYVDAKANIRRFQSSGDVCYYHPTNEYARSIALIGMEDTAFRYASPEAVYVQDGNFMVHGNIICPTSAVQLPGEFNLENACAAISAARHYVTDSAAIEQGIRSFAGLPHRLQFVAEKNGIRYYDDSIATTPGSAIAAMNSFSSPKVLILGGESKGAQFNEVITVARQSGAKIVAMGQTGKTIMELAKAAAVPAEYVDGPMDQVVRVATKMASGHGVVLLSPAATSFDRYKNYSDRGDQFARAVKTLPD